MRRLSMLFVVVLLAVAIGPMTHAYAQGKVVRLTLIDENGSGEDGSAQVTDLGNGTTRVELIVLNAPEGAQQPASIHQGSCANLDADVDFPLETVKGSKSTTTVKTTLAELTNDKHAIVVLESPSSSKIISCGNLPSAAVVAGGTMTLAQVMTLLEDQASELAGEIEKKEADGSQHAYDAYHATFAAHEGEIQAKDKEAWQDLEDAMHDVKAELDNGDWAGAERAAEELVNTVEEAATKVAGATTSTGSGTSSSSTSSGAGSSLSAAMDQLKDSANDLIRETTNHDKPGSDAAYTEFHDLFAANEDALKAVNAEAQAHIEEAMHEVRDAVAAADWAKASTAAKELLNEVNDAIGELAAKPAGVPATGEPGGFDWLLVVAALGLVLLLAGRRMRRMAI